MAKSLAGPDNLGSNREASNGRSEIFVPLTSQFTSLTYLRHPVACPSHAGMEGCLLSLLVMVVVVVVVGWLLSVVVVVTSRDSGVSGSWNQQ